MVTRLLFFIFLMNLVSCGPKNAETSSVNLKVFKSNMVGTIALGGGILIVGKSEDGKNSFRFGLTNPSENLSINLARGKWEFAAIAWEGTNGPLTGKNRCAYTGFVDLKDEEASIALNLSTIRCATDFNGRQFSHIDYKEPATGEFYDFFPVMCISSTLTSANCSYSAPNPTNFLSYKIIFSADRNGEAQIPLSSLSSNCLPMGTSPRAKIPVTDTKSDGPFGVKTLFFTNSTCSGEPVVYDFDDGLKDNFMASVLSATSYSVGYYSFLYINPGITFDNRPIEPQYFTLMNGQYDAGITYFRLTSIDYVLSMLPGGVDKICLTTNTVCQPSEWIVPAISGTLSILSGDGAKSLRLFYKTLNGVVSTNPYISTFILDTTPPSSFSVLTPSSTASAAAGVTVMWNNGIEDNFKKITVKICDDMACGTIRATQEVTTFGTTQTFFTPGEISPSLSYGETVYFNLKVEDKAGNFTIFTSSAKSVAF